MADFDTFFSKQKNDDSFAHIWDELLWRDLVHVSTDEQVLREHLSSGSITFYCGFDPTAPSLHLGNLAQILTMRRLQLAGHKPLALVGGSTGLIGDPRPTAERVLNTKETVQQWSARLQEQLSRFLPQTGSNPARLVNNFDWTENVLVLDFLRDIGKHFRVGTMIKKDAVAARLAHEEGISYTEFSYQILQAFDYLQLFRRYECTLQTGGSDQWGNFTAGIDLVRKMEQKHVHALGTPLILNSDGSKFGKSEGNAIWLDVSLTSVYAMYQFWLNTDDADVIARLKTFTFLTREEILEYERELAEHPAARKAQKHLAYEVTYLVHGAAAVEAVLAATEALFGKGDLRSIDPITLEAALRELPNATMETSATVAQALAKTGLASSLSEARRLVAQKGISINNVAIDDSEESLQEHLLDGNMLVIRRGKKTLVGVFIEFVHQSSEPYAQLQKEER